MFRSLLGGQGGGLEMLAFGLLISLMMFYATFSMGRSFAA